mmetsp:Transcript_67179/g.157564  ORF Transcript_67179/g.157564 Transcript_67179/m.157564 type:complete len:240 (+) Transcript_67179:3303-4022(+)
MFRSSPPEGLRVLPISFSRALQRHLLGQVGGHGLDLDILHRLDPGLLNGLDVSILLCAPTRDGGKSEHRSECGLRLRTAEGPDDGPGKAAGRSALQQRLKERLPVGRRRQSVHGSLQQGLQQDSPIGSRQHVHRSLQQGLQQHSRRWACHRVQRGIPVSQEETSPGFLEGVLVGRLRRSSTQGAAGGPGEAARRNSLQQGLQKPLPGRGRQRIHGSLSTLQLLFDRTYQPSQLVLRQRT